MPGIKSIKSLFTKRNLLIVFVLGALGITIWYFQLSNRHKAIVKTTFLHTLGIIDNDWEVAYNESSVKLESPALLVDDIYQSMDGPQAMINLDMNPDSTVVRFITGFKAEVMRKGTDMHNNDFLCHTNIDFFNGVHYKNLALPKRINSQYPRLGTLSNGINHLAFPPGFGFPVAGNDKFIIASRTLNHNIENPFFQVKHHIDFDLAPEGVMLKPLVPKALVLLQDFDRDAPYDSEKNDPKLCTPIDLKNHSFPNAQGVRFAAHWVLPKGKHQYEFDVTYQLKIDQDATIHAMAAHLHPNAESFTLFDKTMGRVVYTFNCENYADKIGLKNVPVYSSADGIPIYKDHEYSLQLMTNNSKEGFRDMMAVLFIYLYDAEMDQHLQSL